MAVNGLYRIDAGFQQYDWGKHGLDSAVAQFALKNSDGKLSINDNEPYAELWMGTHPKVPSYIRDEDGNSKQTLRELISTDPEGMLGRSVINKFGKTDEIPFLFKVLSIEKVLSIQAHPDKELGKKLHFQDPSNYPDDNHKPEMAIALTPFEGFCGFKPLQEIADELIKIPELRNIVGEEISSQFIKGIKPNAIEGSEEDISNRGLLQSVFSQVMNCDEATIVENARSLIKRATESPNDFNDSSLPDLLIRLNNQFPDDIGLFCGGLLLNHCNLKAGEAMFLSAKDPHAYIYGDIIECMAASDNVVRAGFTPKFKDVPNLVSMLTYSYASVEKQKMELEPFERSSGAGTSILYDPPIEEFSVLQTNFSNSIGTREFKGLNGPSILITTKGTGFIQSGDLKLEAKPGYTFFIAPNTEIKLIAEDEEFTTYRAFVEAN